MSVAARLLGSQLLQRKLREVPVVAASTATLFKFRHSQQARNNAVNSLLVGAIGLPLAYFFIGKAESGPQVTHAEAATAAASASPSTSFQLRAALEFKEEMQKIKMARFLNELTKLVEARRKGELQPHKTELPTMCDQTKVDLTGIDLFNLTTEEVLYIMDNLHNEAKELEIASLIQLFQAATLLFKKEDTLVDKRNTETVTVVGDIHGCIPSMMSILDLLGDLSEENRCVVFAGDFVDRGDDSLEVLTTLLLLKLAYPDQVVLVRGNHEDSMVATVYGFADELKKKYKLDDRSMKRLWDTLSKTFAALPLAVVTDTAFIVHGGLPSRDFRLDQVRKLTFADRSKYDTLVQPTSSTGKLIEKLLWSDPSEIPGIHPNKRGTGVEFGPDVAEEFLTREKLNYLVRGHEPTEHGMKVLDCGNGKKVVTIFSAANYPNGLGKSLGAVLNLYSSDGAYRPIQFPYQPRNKQKSNQSEPFAKMFWNLAEQAEATVMSLFTSNLAPSLDESMRKFLTQNKSKLVRSFEEVEKDHLVTVDQWVEVMHKALDLKNVSWETLQPEVAPTIDPEGKYIDWREYLIENSTGVVEALNDKEKMANAVDHEDKMLAIFEFLDVNESGAIEKAEFLAGVHILNRHHLPKNRQIRDPDALFAKFDDDGNGVVGLEEFKEHLSHSHLVSSSISKSMGRGQVETLARNHEILKLAFEFLDADGSGTVDYEEWKVGIDMLNKQLSPHEKLYDARELFSLMDRDGSGNIDLNEFNKVFGSL